MARKVSVILLGLLSLFLLGTTIVLSTTKAYLRIDDWSYITETEVPLSAGKKNVSEAERIPRILHQTWKTDTLPERWVEPSRHCRDLMPDYEYMLWTDETSRQLIAEHYPWFLPTFDGYTYPIQRADAIRYFVLHRFGGVYLDLDIGCIRSVDPLLDYEVILPKTIPVGVSNDLMFSAKGHPFMEQVIHGLITFDINYILNYPTVMFSTGPMFMSAQFGIYMASHPPTAQNPNGDVRILPKALYGKNAKPGEAPHAFFEHYYASSWHSDDAWLWTFLGLWGMRLMYVTVIFAVIAGGRMYLMKNKRGVSSRGGGRRRLMFGHYEVVLPRFRHDGDHTQLDVGPFSISIPGHSRDASSSSIPSGRTSMSESDSTDETRYPSELVPLSLDVTPTSPTPSSSSTGSPTSSSPVSTVLKRAGAWLADAISNTTSEPSRSRSGRRRRSRGILFFLPAVFTPRSPSMRPPSRRLSSTDLSETVPLRGSRTPRSRSPQPEDVENNGPMVLGGAGGKLVTPELLGSRPLSPAPPPPYASSRTATPGGGWNPPTSAASTASWQTWTDDGQ
ncbi:hypothetical protein FRB94_000110 [Tulasnella sp. JGI-2019a]|nr:hypothetical protein FRB94_000110 [Tulasnella sp. JGI-2019a]